MDLSVVYLMTHTASTVLMIMMANGLEMMGRSCRDVTPWNFLVGAEECHKKSEFRPGFELGPLPYKIEGR
jgi:hypothetical protein